MLTSSHTNRVVLASSVSAVLAVMFLFACGADEVGPADDSSDATSGGTSTGNTNKVGGSANKEGSTSSTTGTRVTNQGGASPVGQGGANVGNGGALANQGGRVGQGGFSLRQQGGATADPNQSSCVRGVQTGSACNPEIDTTECKRNTRICTCDAATSEWNCVNTNTGGAGAPGTGGRNPGVGGSGPGVGGVAGGGKGPTVGGTSAIAAAGKTSSNVAGNKH